MDAAAACASTASGSARSSPGPTGSIADVAGVRVGHVTVVRDEPDPPAGRGVARSGVTAILPGDPHDALGGADPRRRGGAQRRR